VRNISYYFDNLAVVKTARTPAVFLEAGIIVNRADELLLMTPDTHTRIDAAVAQGLADCGVASSQLRELGWQSLHEATCRNRPCPRRRTPSRQRSADHAAVGLGEQEHTH
jgi:hypothetical protein